MCFVMVLGDSMKRTFNLQRGHDLQVKNAVLELTTPHCNILCNDALMQFYVDENHPLKRSQINIELLQT